MIISIDGPAASGKSTVGRDLAAALSYLFFDTGVMYRAVAWAAHARAVALEDPAALTALAESLDIDVRPATVDDGRQYDVLVDGQDVTWDIRTQIVDSTVSIVAAISGVRSALTKQQRAIGLRGNAVLIGRDIGTVVLPEADLKIYLDASAEERARRRTDEILARGGEAVYEDILASMRQRDTIDANRDVAPLKAAEDAVIIRSDDMTANQVVSSILALVESR
ncbi:MAG: (d)CMP kinase, partial [Anaerolineales bacterium]|nr:(d)CMP kinase [Anaerolineales bacterium]